MQNAHTKVFLIRHGEVEQKDLFNGHRDVLLSSVGLAQMTRTADRLPPVDAVFSSDLKRSAMGAGMIAAKQQIPHIVMEDLREMNFGVWEGMSAEEIASKFPEQWQAFMKDISTFRPESGETFNEVTKRVLKCYSSILQRYREKSIAILAHGGVNRIILNSLLNLGKEIFYLAQDYAKVNIIEYQGDSGLIRLVNGDIALDA